MKTDELYCFNRKNPDESTISALNSFRLDVVKATSSNRCCIFNVIFDMFSCMVQYMKIIVFLLLALSLCFYDYVFF